MTANARHGRRAGWAAIAPALLAALLLLGSCAGDSDEVPQGESPEVLYNRAMEYLHRKSFENAAETFSEIERQHPYSVWATRGQLMASFSHYQNNKYDESVVAARRFIQLHPGHEDVAYAHYLIGISYYEQISDVSRDQEMTFNALDAFQELIRRFPDSDYARDARQKVVFARDHLAGKEMEIGRYYLKQGYYIAAINRFQAVVDRFETTTHVPEALHRLVEAYLSLGLVDEAQKTAAVLGYNFPDSEWYRDSYELMKEHAPQIIQGDNGAAAPVRNG
ncbi:MAG: outer membrane protein assembly factor BamD [Alphaproteobacteria bacterium]